MDEKASIVLVLVIVFFLPLLTIEPAEFCSSETRDPGHNIKCSHIKCPSLTACDGANQAVARCTSVGGCCHSCISLLNEGNDCKFGSKLIKCSAGLVCDKKSQKCQINENIDSNAQCLKQQLLRMQMAGNSYQILSVNYDGKRVLKMSGFKYAAINEMPLPSCDQITGKFEPKQCKDRICFCVDPDTGHRIFGKFERSEAENKTCSCAVELSKQIATVDQKIDFYSDVHVHCDSSGNYELLQCSGRFCYCADSKTGQPEGELVLRNAIKLLACYDHYNKINLECKTLHNKKICQCYDPIAQRRWYVAQEDQNLCYKDPDPYEPVDVYKVYLRTCDRKLQISMNMTKHFKKKGVEVIGLNSVECQLDGRFAPRHCDTSRCFCIEPDGKILKSYFPEQSDKHCHCARQEYDIDVNEKNYDKLLCNGFGNFRSFQHFEEDSLSFCVDDDGTRISNIVALDQILQDKDINFERICDGMKNCLLNSEDCFIK